MTKLYEAAYNYVYKSSRFEPDNAYQRILKEAVDSYRKRMTKEQITKLVKDIIFDNLGIPQDKIADGQKLKADLGADSLDAVEIVMDLEREFDIDIDDNDAEKFERVGDVIEYMYKRFESDE